MKRYANPHTNEFFVVDDRTNDLYSATSNHANIFIAMDEAREQVAKHLKHGIDEVVWYRPVRKDRPPGVIKIT